MRVHHINNVNRVLDVLEKQYSVSRCWPQNRAAICWSHGITVASCFIDVTNSSVEMCMHILVFYVDCQRIGSTGKSFQFGYCFINEEP